MTKRASTAELICDLAADYMASRERGVGIVELAPSILEQLVVEALRADGRFTESSRGKWELVASVEQREEVMV